MYGIDLGLCRFKVRAVGRWSLGVRAGYRNGYDGLRV